LKNLPADDTPLPWRALLHFGFRHLKLSPQEFWSMTLHELSAALQTTAGSAGALQRDDLDRLMTSYPDTDTTGAAHEQI
jgi:uncharacterized phage protein (TIGR02216 family)